MTLHARNFTQDPDAAYPQDAVEVTVWGHGKIAMRAVFEAEAKRKWMEIVGIVEKGTGNE